MTYKIRHSEIRNLQKSGIKVDYSVLYLTLRTYWRKKKKTFYKLKTLISNVKIQIINNSLRKMFVFITFQTRLFN